MKALKRPATNAAQRELAKIRRMISESRMPSLQMTEDEVIQTLRKTREQLWESKVAARSR